MDQPITFQRPKPFFFEETPKVPNNPRLPTLVYQVDQIEGALSLASHFKKLFDRNGWPGAWTNGIYSFQHFHSNTHEVLGIASGKAKVLLGGDGGQVFDLEKGNVVVLPAGVGHKNLGCSDDFCVIGSYPKGCDHDTLKADSDADPEIKKRIAATPVPETDPVFGENGPLLELWSIAAE